MKQDNKLKIVMITLVIILISLISFVGIYVKKQNRMENIVPDYLLGMDLKGSRVINLKVDDTTEEVIKDGEGNIIESATDDEITEKGYIKEAVPVNKEDDLTKDNFEKSKQIIEKRLKDLKVSNYLVKQDKDSGTIVVELAENTQTDNIVQYLNAVGKLEIVDSDTEEVLMNNDDLKEAKAIYNSSTSVVYVDIQFKKDSNQKLKEITEKYISTTDESGNTVQKKVTLKLDDQTILSTYFDEPIQNGKLQLSIGSSASTGTDLSDYIEQANEMATLLNDGKMPITYTIESNKYIQSSIQENSYQIAIISVIIVIALMLVYLIIKYKKDGILSAISYIGASALVLLIIRLTNVVLTIEGLIAILLILLINYIFTIIILNKTKNVDKNGSNKKAVNTAIIKCVFLIIPVYIISIVFCFISYLPINSFGMVMFWGITLDILYHIIITKSLLLKD